jgi:hypothetical protein
MRLNCLTCLDALLSKLLCDETLGVLHKRGCPPDTILTDVAANESFEEPNIIPTAFSLILLLMLGLRRFGEAG